MGWDLWWSRPLSPILQVRLKGMHWQNSQHGVEEAHCEDSTLNLEKRNGRPSKASNSLPQLTLNVAVAVLALLLLRGPGTLG